MDKDILISLKNIGIYYWRRLGFFKRQAFWVLKDVSFDLKKGETLGIIGRNGVGKSTLLRIIAGIIEPNQGKIVSNGINASLLSLQVGFNQQLSGRENAIISGMMLGLPRKDIIQKLDGIIAFSELDEFIDQPIKTYSTGMLARLGFSVALQANPDLLLIDEVMGVGDEAFKRKSTKALRERIRSNQTVVLVSHSPLLIKEVCDRAIWIENGVTQTEGLPEEVLKQYQANLPK